LASRTVVFVECAYGRPGAASRASSPQRDCECDRRDRRAVWAALLRYCGDATEVGARSARSRLPIAICGCGHRRDGHRHRAHRYEERVTHGGDTSRERDPSA
jgi:hypothetical protein